MAHGNKKYNFDLLQEPGDTIKVKTANVYSLRNSLRLYAIEKKLGDWKDYFDAIPINIHEAKVTRIA